MKNNITYSAKIALKGILNLIFINALSFVSSLFVFFIGFYLISNGNNQISNSFLLIKHRPISIIICLLSTIVPFISIFFLSQKFVYSNTIIHLIKTNSDSVFILLEKKLKLDRLFNKKTEVITTQTLRSTAHNKEQIKNKGIINRALNFLLKQYHLNDIKFDIKNIESRTALKEKLMQFILEIITPSLIPFFIIFGLQWLSLLLIYLLKI